MLTDTYPSVPPVMPEPRSLMHTCFVERDAEYYSELERLKGAIIVSMTDGLEVAKIAELIASSGLVKIEELSIASLTRGRLLVHLPTGLAPDSIIRAIPAEAWDMGLDFQQWSPLHDAAINIPNYKIIINLLDVPPPLYREKQMIRATSGIGVYLGTIAQADPLNLEVWTAVIATDNLERVPPAVTMVIGGLQFTMQIKVLKVSSGPIYTTEDLPTMPQKYKKPEIERPGKGDSSSGDEDEHFFKCSTKVLQELCEGRDKNSIPPKIQEMLAGIRQPRLSKEDLIAYLLHHEPDNSATENPSTKSDGESESHLGPVTQDPVIEGMQLSDTVDLREQALPQTQRLHGIPCIGETSGVIKEGLEHASNNNGPGNSKRDTARSHTSRDGKINRGKTRSLIRTKANGLQSTELGPVPMKKQLKRVDSKTRYGLLHRRPHGKGSQMLPRGLKSSANQEFSFALQSRDCLLRKGGVHSKLRKQCLGKKVPPTSKTRPAQFQNGPSIEQFKSGINYQDPSDGINLLVNPGGFYSVHVGYDRCKTLADGCGLNESDVDETVIEENQYLRQVVFNPEQNDQQDQGERVCTDPMTTDDEETETD